MNRIFLIAAAALVSSVAAAQSIPKFKKDAPYSQVRAQLIKAGYIVEKLPAAETDRCAPGRTEVCEIYPETRWCLGTGQAKCEFVMRARKGAPIQVTTLGEDNDPAVQSIKRMSDSDISRLLAE